MTYYAADDGTWTVPVIDTNGGTLDIPTSIHLRNSAGETTTATGTWTGAAAPHPTKAGATVRNLGVPLNEIPAGLWSLRLTIDADPDLFLGNVYIQ